MRLPTFERSEVLVQINDAAPTSFGSTVSRILRLRYGWGVGVDLGAVKEISFDGFLTGGIVGRDNKVILLSGN
jgi:hypothetical protein